MNLPKLKLELLEENEISSGHNGDGDFDIKLNSLDSLRINFSNIVSNTGCFNMKKGSVKLQIGNSIFQTTKPSNFGAFNWDIAFREGLKEKSSSD